MYNLDMPRSSRFNVQIDPAATHRGLPRQKTNRQKTPQTNPLAEIFLNESRKSTFCVFKKNQNAPRPSEHPPVRGRKCQNVSHLFWTSDVWTRTSRGHTGGRSQMISPPSLYGACLIFYREKDSAAPFPRRPGSRILCTHELICSPLVGHVLFFL